MQASTNTLDLLRHQIKQENIPAFGAMVKNIFKTDIPGNYSALMHAAVGLCSELVEFNLAKTRENVIEECGDLEFYAEAVLQHTPKMSPEMAAFFIDTESTGSAIGDFSMDVANNVSAIIDLAKKSWIYGRELDQKKADDIHGHVHSLRAVLSSVYDTIGVTREEVLLTNQVKLVGGKGRYAGGVYSDAAALARADKKRVWIVEDTVGISLTMLAGKLKLPLPLLQQLNPQIEQPYDLIPYLTAVNLPDAE